MIIAENLRIGNWVEYLGEWHYVQCIDPFRVHLMGNLLDTKLEEINPIPLTPAILEKAGFEVRYVESHYYKGDFSISLYDNLVYLRTYDGDDLSAEVKTVHHLQNLYYFLRGEELEINLADND